MLEYEWGNPSSILLSGGEGEEEPTQDSDQTRQIFDQYNQNLAGNLFSLGSTNYISAQPFQQQQQQQQQQQNQSPLLIYDDPRIYTTNNNLMSYPHPANPPTSLVPESMAAGASNNLMMMQKSEDICVQRAAAIDYSARIGLNLGGRTYFSSEDDFVNRFYRRSRPLESGPSNTPRCQAEGCNADLTHSKHYHRRHKVCEFHSKAATVLTGGLTQRFCQQCSRFHLLSEFDQGKRSCRKRLADHNRRRRKSSNPPPPPPQQQQQQQQSPIEIPPKGSSPDSGGMHSSSSSVTVAILPMECRHNLVMRNT